MTLTLSDAEQRQLVQLLIKHRPELELLDGAQLVKDGLRVQLSLPKVGELEVQIRIEAADG